MVELYEIVRPTMTHIGCVELIGKSQFYIGCSTFPFQISQKGCFVQTGWHQPASLGIPVVLLGDHRRCSFTILLRSDSKAFLLRHTRSSTVNTTERAARSQFREWRNTADTLAAKPVVQHLSQVDRTFGPPISAPIRASARNLTVLPKTIQRRT